MTETWTVGDKTFTEGETYPSKDGEGPERQLVLMHLGVDPCVAYTEGDDPTKRWATLKDWLEWVGE